MPADSRSVTIHCKAGSVSVRFVFETRAKCQDFVARHKDDGIPFAIDSPFYCANTTFTVRQSKSIEDRQIENSFRLCGERWLVSSNFSLLMEMTMVHS